MKKEVFEAIATLVGCVIGAGVLGIPYVVAKSGVLVGVIEILGLGITILITNLLLGEIVLRTKGNHQLTGYAEEYIGGWGKKLMLFSMILLIYGAMIAYIIGVGKSLSTIWSIISPSGFSMIFFLIMAVFIFIGLKVIDKSELIFSMIMLCVIVIMSIAIFSSESFFTSNLNGFELSNLFLPFGVILFALGGTVAIPEMKEELGKDKKMLKKCIIIGSLIILFIYTSFSIAVIGVNGKETTEIATIGLGETIGWEMTLFGNLFAVFAMTTSFLALGLALKEMYMYDYNLSKKLSWGLTCFIPIIIYLLGVRSFINTIGIAGGFAVGISGIIIILMHRKAVKTGDRKPEYTISDSKILSGILIGVFCLGIIYQILSLFNVL